MRFVPYRRLDLHVDDPPPCVLAKLRAKTAPRPPPGLETPRLPFVGVVTDGGFRLVEAFAGMRWHIGRNWLPRRITPFVVVAGRVHVDGNGSRVRLRIRISYRELAFFAPWCAFVLLGGVRFFQGWVAGTKHGFGVVLAAGMLLVMVAMVSRAFRHASERMVAELRHVLLGERARLGSGRRPGARWPRNNSRRRAARRGR